MTWQVDFTNEMIGHRVCQSVDILDRLIDSRCRLGGEPGHEGFARTKDLDKSTPDFTKSQPFFQKLALLKCSTCFDKV